MEAGLMKKRANKEKDIIGCCVSNGKNTITRREKWKKTLNLENYKIRDIIGR